MSKNKNLPQKSAPNALVALSPLQLYMREVARYPLLSPQEEYELAVKHYENQDIEAAHRLVTSNLRLVVKIAYEFQKTRADILDLIQEGNAGLMHAVKKFNPYKGVKLSTYAAWWIRAYILRYILENQGQIKLATTAAQRKLFYNLQKETQKLLSAYNDASPKLLAAALDVREEDVVEMQKRLASSEISLDAPVNDQTTQDATKNENFIIDDQQEPIDNRLAQEEIKQRFQKHLDEFAQKLKGRDREIFDLRLMSDQPLTLQEIGDRYNISRERARQIEARIINNLKKFVQEKGDVI